MNEKFLILVKKKSKKLLALLIVASMIFNANFFDAVKIIYADVLVDNKEVYNEELKEDINDVSDDIIIEENNNDNYDVENLSEENNSMQKNDDKIVEELDDKILNKDKIKEENNEKPSLEVDEEIEEPEEEYEEENEEETYEEEPEEDDVEELEEESSEEADELISDNSNEDLNEKITYENIEIEKTEETTNDGDENNEVNDLKEEKLLDEEPELEDEELIEDELVEEESGNNENELEVDDLNEENRESEENNLDSNLSNDIFNEEQIDESIINEEIKETTNEELEDKNQDDKKFTEDLTTEEKSDINKNTTFGNEDTLVINDNTNYSNNEEETKNNTEDIIATLSEACDEEILNDELQSNENTNIDNSVKDEIKNNNEDIIASISDASFEEIVDDNEDNLATASNVVDEDINELDIKIKDKKILGSTRTNTGTIYKDWTGSYLSGSSANTTFSYTITYGLSTPENGFLIDNVPVNLGIPLRDGYWFAGWKITFTDGIVWTYTVPSFSWEELTSDSGTTTIYKHRAIPGSGGYSYSSGNVTGQAVAQWRKKVYGVTLNANGATTPGTDNIFVWHKNGIYTNVDCTTSLTSITIPTKTSSTFLGYYRNDKQMIKADGTVNSSNFTHSSFEENVEFVARWREIYTVTLNTTSGSTAAVPNIIYEDYDKELYSNSTYTTIWDNKITKPTRTGYTFKGYGSGTDGSGTQYIDENGYRNLTNFKINTFTGNTIIYPKWENNVYHVEINQDGGSGGVGDLFVKYGVNIYKDSTCGTVVSGALTTPIKSNYLFAGYYDADTLTTQYVKSNGTVNTTNFTSTKWNHADTAVTIKMKAKWVPVYKITLDTNGGNTAVSPTEVYITAGTDSKTTGVYKEVSCTNAFTGITTAPTKQNRVFKGFVNDSAGGVGSGIEFINASGTKTTNFAIGQFEGNTSIYAKWDPQIYEISLNSSGATSAGTAKVFEKYDVGIYDNIGCSGSAIDHIAQVPSRTNYYFKGYFLSDVQYINETGNFTSNFKANSFTSGTTLTAQWGQKFVITLNENGGSITTPNKIYVDKGIGLYTDTSYSVPWTSNSVTVPTRLGYKFKGFVENPTGSGTEYINQLGYRNTTNFTENTFTSDKQIYAKWDNNIYHVEIDQDGGAGGTNDLWVKYADKIYKNNTCSTAVGTTITIPTKTNCFFAGYYDTTLTTQYVKEDGTINTSEFSPTTWDSDETEFPIQMKAKWSPIWTIRLDNNGGNGVDPSYLYVTKGTDNKAGGVFTDISCNEITRFTTLSTKPTKNNMIFKGFVKGANGGKGNGTEYIDLNGDIINSMFVPSAFNADTTIYAAWENKVYEITLNNASADITGTPKIYLKYNEGKYADQDCLNVLNNIVPPQKTGGSIVFKGYYYGDLKYIDASGAYTTNFTDYAFNGPTILTAHWGERFIITFDKNGGNVDAVPDKVYIDNGVGIYSDPYCSSPWNDSIVKPKKPGYSFKGFGSDLDGGGTEYINQDGYRNTTNFTPNSFTANKTIRAKWENNIYHVVIDQDEGSSGTSELWVKYDDKIYSDSGCSTEVTAALDIPTKAEYLFAGYYDTTLTTQYVNENGNINTTNFTPTTWNSENLAVQMKAKWVPVYKILLDNNGGSGVIPTEVYVTDGTDNIVAGVYDEFECINPFAGLSSFPTKTNRVFKGFVKSAAAGVGEGTLFIDESGNKTTDFIASQFTTEKKIYAKWDSAIYQINLNNNSADTTGTQKLYEKYEVGIYGEGDPYCSGTAITFITRPTKADRIFKGYYFNSIKYIDENGNLTANFTNNAFDGITDLTAEWGQGLEITFEKNNGDTEATPNKVFIDKGVGIYRDVNYMYPWEGSLTTLPTRAGYTFKGFSENPDGSGSLYILQSGYRDSVIFTSNSFTAHTPIYAKWENNIYHVEINQDGGAGGTNDLWIKFNDNIYTNVGCSTPIGANIIIPTKTNYLFAGYYDNSLTTQYVKDDGSLTSNFTTTNWNYADTVLPIQMKAKWIPVYQITLDTNGGNPTAPIGVVYVTEGTEHKLEGVYMDATCNTSYTPITTFPTKVNRVFDGFVQNPNGGYGSGTLYIDRTGALTTNFVASAFNGDKNIYAKWGSAIYTITLNKNGGDTQGTEKLYERYEVGIYGETDPDCTGSEVSAITKPTKSDRVFKGYYFGGVRYIDENGALTPNFTNNAFDNHKELTAEWGQELEISFDKNDGDIEAVPNKVYIDKGVGIYTDIDKIYSWDGQVTTLPTRLGYTFKGFVQNPNGSGTEYINQSGYRVSSAFTENTFSLNTPIYAKWDNNIYHIVIDQDGGTSGTSNLWVKYNDNIYLDSICGTAISSNIIVPTKTNYLFAGYYDTTLTTQYVKEDGSINTSEFTTTTWNNSNTSIPINMKAKWIPVYKIQLNTNGSITPVTPEYVYVTEGTENKLPGVYMEVLCNTSYTSLTIPPTKTHKDFKGFVKEAGGGIGSGTVYIDESGAPTADFVASEFLTTNIIYAKWDPAVYNIELNSDGAENPGTTMIYEKYDIGIFDNPSCTGIATSSIAKPVKSGNVFKGYYLGTIKYIDESGNFTTNFNSRSFEGHTILNAMYGQRFDINFNKNDGDTEASPNKVYVDNGVGIYKDPDCLLPWEGNLTTLPTRLGHTFKGFYENPDGSGVQYINSAGYKDIVTFTESSFGSNTPIYAKWDKNKYHLIIDQDGGVYGTNNLWVKYGVNIYLDESCGSVAPSTLTIPTKVGYLFAGYYDETLTTKYVNENGTINFSSTEWDYEDTILPVRMKAKWSPVYKITLDTNSGSTVSPSELYVTNGTDSKVAGVYLEDLCNTPFTNLVTLPTKPGKSFKGFVKDANGGVGGGIGYIDEYGAPTLNFTASQFSGDTRIYGWWGSGATSIYQITLNNGGAEVPGTSKIYEKYEEGIYGEFDPTCSDYIIATINEPRRIGYSFKGYYESSFVIPYIDADAHILSTLNGTTFTENVVLKAKWENNIYKIDLNNNGADLGYSGTTNLYVKYNSGIYTDSACVGTTVNALTQKPTKSHCIFGGYYIGDVEYINADGVFNTTNFTKTTWSTDDTTTHIEMLAKWIPVHKITLNKNNLDLDSTDANPNVLYLKEGVGVYVDEACTTPFTILSSTPTRSEYGFNGFVANNNGTGTIYINANGTINPAFSAASWTTDKVIYASWGSGIFKVSFDKNGGDTNVSPSEVYVKKGVGIFTSNECITPWAGPITKPSKLGYTFKGITKNPNGTGLEYIKQNGTINTANFTNDSFDADTTLYTKWENSIYTIEFDKTGGSGGSNNVYVKYNTGIYKNLACTTLLTKIDKPVKTGFAFDGYYDTSLTTEYIKADGSINTSNFLSTLWTNPDTTIHIYMKAKWIPVHKITLDKNTTDAGSEDSTPNALWLEEGVGVFADENCNTLFTELVQDPSRPGFGFHGFVENTDGTGIEYIDGSGMINSANLNGSTWTSDATIYAKWGDRLYKITLDSDEAENEGTKKLYEKYGENIYGEYECTTVLNSISVPEKNNFIFDGYFDKETMTIKYINADGTFNTSNFSNTTFEKPTTLKAKWHSKIYKITLKATDSEVLGTTHIYEKYGIGLYKEASCENVITAINIPKRGISIFTGYFENNDGTGKKYINNNGTLNTSLFTSTAFENDSVIYADYIGIYKITIDTSVGSSKVKTLYKKENAGVYSDAQCTKSINQITLPTRNGYTFIGCWTELNKNGIMYIDDAGNIKKDDFVCMDRIIYPEWMSKSSGGGGGGGGGGDTISSKKSVTGVVKYWNDNTFVTDGKIVMDKVTSKYIYSDTKQVVTNRWVADTTTTNKNVWHYLDSNGDPIKGWNTFNNSWYYFDENGDMFTGTHIIGGVSYYFSELPDANEGKMSETKQIGLVNLDVSTTQNQQVPEAPQIPQTSQVTSTPQIPQVQTVELEPATFVHNSYGNNETSKVSFDNIKNKFYYDDGGLVVDKWIGEKDATGKTKWRYADRYGDMLKGWTVLDDSWYCFDVNGNMLTGKQVIDGIEYYFSENAEDEGKLITTNESELANNNSPAAQLTQNPLTSFEPTSFIQLGYGSNVTKKVTYDNSKNKYLYDDGSIVVNNWIGDRDANGQTKWHYTGQNGDIQKTWLLLGDCIYYFDPNGNMLTGYQQIDGYLCYFVEDGIDQGKLLNYVYLKYFNISNFPV